MDTYSANTIASYILSLPNASENDVSNLKLQKLCYYVQGLVTSMRGGVPLFADGLAAWDHGPVTPSVYHAYKGNGSHPIPIVSDFDPSQIDQRDLTAIEEVYNYYGQFAPWKLRDMTHEERPWIDAYHSNKIITVNALVDFFSPQIDEDFIKNIYG